jgi:hypothetical protein
MLPNSTDHPVGLFESAVRVKVSLSVPLQFFSPPVGIAVRPRGVLGAAVPKTAVDKDGHPNHRKNKVGLSSYLWDWPSMDVVSEATPVQSAA